MATVNWENEPGEKVEEFVEALILTTVNRRATRLTPSRGDRGIDIIAPIGGDQFDIYQVKRFTRPFRKSSSQERSIVNSWEIFVREVLPIYNIRRWNLVMPWNPTFERYNWMLNELTSGADIERDWIGRDSLNVWTAQNTPLYDYYFGNGQNRTLELIAAAISSGREVQDFTGQELLDAVASREIDLAKQLDSVDPFYHYETAIKLGRLSPNMSGPLEGVDSKAAFVTMRDIDESHHLQISVFPTCADSLRLRPISTTVSFHQREDDPSARAMHDFIEYGAEPGVAMPVEVIRAEGPPGVDERTGPALLYVFDIERPTRPDLELRLGDRCVGFTGITVTHGRSGARLTGHDVSNVFEVEITINNTSGTHEASVRTLSLAGKLPHVVASGLEFIREWAENGSAQLAIPHGRILLPLGEMSDSDLVRQCNEWLNVANRLVRLQAVSMQQLRMPASLSQWEFDEIDIAVRLLEGEIIQSDWSSTEFTVVNTEALETMPLFQFLFFKPFSIEYDDCVFELDGTLGTWGVAQLADPAISASVASGDSVTIVPGPQQKLFRQYSPQSYDDLPSGYR